MLSRLLVSILFFTSLEASSEPWVKNFDARPSCDAAAGGIQKCRAQAKVQLNSTTDLKTRCEINWNLTLCAIDAACDSCGPFFPLGNLYEGFLKSDWRDQYRDCGQWYHTYPYVDSNRCIAWTVMIIWIVIIGLPVTILLCVALVRCAGLIYYCFTHRADTQGRILARPVAEEGGGLPEAKHSITKVAAKFVAKSSEMIL